MPDLRPYQHPETDLEADETALDVLNLGLRHSVTDFAMPVVGGQLALAARRVAAPEIFSLENGLLPKDRPDRPLGAGWTTSLCPNIHFIERTTEALEGSTALPGEPVSQLPVAFAEVVDETGKVYQFLKLDLGGGEGEDDGEEAYFPMPSVAYRDDVRSYVLRKEGGVWVFRKKFGNVITFADAEVSRDAEGENWNEKHTWWRAEQVTDRFGTSIHYGYWGDNKLLPGKISFGSREISITETGGENGQVDTVQPPSDSTSPTANISYGFDSRKVDSSEPDTSYEALVSVTSAGVGWGYDYKDEVEEPSEGAPFWVHDYYHVDVGELTPPTGVAYELEYFEAEGESTERPWLYNYPRNEFGELYQQTGLPRMVKKVDLGGEGDAEFKTLGRIAISESGETLEEGYRGTVVAFGKVDGVNPSQSNRNERGYSWNGFELYKMDSFADYMPATGADSWTTPSIMLFAQLDMVHYEGTGAELSVDGGTITTQAGTGQEDLGRDVFEAAKDAGLVLAKLTDFSETEYNYEYPSPGGSDDCSEWRLGLPWGSDLPEEIEYAFTKYSDPESEQTVESGGVQRLFLSFEYRNGDLGAAEPYSWRILEKVSDSNSRETVRNFPSCGDADAPFGRVESIVTSQSGTLLSKTDFDQYDSVYRAFPTKIKIYGKRTADPVGQDILYEFDPDGDGRLQQVRLMKSGGGSINNTFAYFDDGCLKSVTNAFGTTQITYDTLRRQKKLIHPDMTERENFYGEGQGDYFLSRVRDEDGHDTKFGYDVFGWNNSVTRVMPGGTDIVNSAQFDILGSIESATDPRSTLSFEHDALQRLTKTVFPAGTVDPAELDYPKTVKMQGAQGDSDEAGRPGSIAFADLGFSPTWAKAPNGLVSKQTHNGLYQPHKSRLEASDGVDMQSVALFDIYDRQTSFTPPNGYAATTWNHFDLTGEYNVTTGGVSASSFVTPAGIPWKSIDPDSGVWQVTELDSTGTRVKKAQGPAVPDGNSGGVSTNPVYSYEYDDDSPPVTDPATDFQNCLGVTYTDPTLRESRVLLDNRGMPVVQLGPDSVNGKISATSPRIQTSYNGLGQPATVTDPLGNVTAYAYDAAARLETVEGPTVSYFDKSLAPPTGSAKPKVKYGYFGDGLVKDVTQYLSGGAAPAVVSTSFDYDLIGRPTTTTFPAGAHHPSFTNVFDYSPAGASTTWQSATDGLGNESQSFFDSLGRPTKEVLGVGAANQTTDWTYDDALRQAQRTRSGETTTFVNNSLGRLQNVLYPSAASAQDLTFSYKSSGLLEDVSAGGGDVLTSVAYQYDALGRLTHETSNNATQQTDYDLADRPVRFRVDSGAQDYTLGQDNQGRLDEIKETSSGIVIATYAYDDNGRVVLRGLNSPALTGTNGDVYSAGVFTEYGYDPAGRLTYQGVPRSPYSGSFPDLANFTLSHDLRGNVSKIEERTPGWAGGDRDIEVEYDQLSRIYKELVTKGATSTEYEYEFDAGNNLKKKKRGKTDVLQLDYNGNELNQVATLHDFDADEEVEYLYDNLGRRRLATRTEAGNPSNVISEVEYVHDEEGRLVWVEESAGTLYEVGYTYDFLSRRVRTVITQGGSTDTTEDSYSGRGSVTRFDVASGGARSAALEYARGLGLGGDVGDLLRTKDPTVGGDERFLHYNGRGDVVGQTDGANAATWRASYEAYGRVADDTGVPLGDQRANTKELGISGMLDYGYRWRDPDIGTFIAQDPGGMVDGLNLYQFASNNPWSGHGEQLSDGTGFEYAPADFGSQYSAEPQDPVGQPSASLGELILEPYYISDKPFEAIARNLAALRQRADYLYENGTQLDAFAANYQLLKAEEDAFRFLGRSGLPEIIGYKLGGWSEAQAFSDFTRTVGGPLAMLGISIAIGGPVFGLTSAGLTAMAGGASSLTAAGAISIAGVSGATSGVAVNSFWNAAEGDPLLEGTLGAAVVGAAFGAGGRWLVGGYAPAPGTPVRTGRGAFGWAQPTKLDRFFNGRDVRSVLPDSFAGWLRAGSHGGLRRNTLAWSHRNLPYFHTIKQSGTGNIVGWSLSRGRGYGAKPRIDFHPLWGNPKNIVPWARGRTLPHYHRRGGTGGIGRHRPWQKPGSAEWWELWRYF